MAEALIIRARHLPGHMLITVAGDIGIAAPQLCDRLTALAVSGRRLVVDLNQVGFLGAAGLNVLAAATRTRPSTGLPRSPALQREALTELIRAAGLVRRAG